MSEKSRFSSTIPKATWQTRLNTVGIKTAAPLPYLFITANKIELEKIYFSAIQNLKTVC